MKTTKYLILLLPVALLSLAGCDDDEVDYPEPDVPESIQPAEVKGTSWFFEMASQTSKLNGEDVTYEAYVNRVVKVSIPYDGPVGMHTTGDPIWSDAIQIAGPNGAVKGTNYWLHGSAPLAFSADNKTISLEFTVDAWGPWTITLPDGVVYPVNGKSALAARTVPLQLDAPNTEGAISTWIADNKDDDNKTSLNKLLQFSLEFNAPVNHNADQLTAADVKIECLMQSAEIDDFGHALKDDYGNYKPGKQVNIANPKLVSTTADDARYPVSPVRFGQNFSEQPQSNVNATLDDGSSVPHLARKFANFSIVLDTALMLSNCKERAYPYFTTEVTNKDSEGIPTGGKRYINYHFKITIPAAKLGFEPTEGGSIVYNLNGALDDNDNKIFIPANGDIVYEFDYTINDKDGMKATEVQAAAADKWEEVYNAKYPLAGDAKREYKEKLAWEKDNEGLAYEDKLAWDKDHTAAGQSYEDKIKWETDHQGLNFADMLDYEAKYQEQGYKYLDKLAWEANHPGQSYENRIVD